MHRLYHVLLRMVCTQLLLVQAGDAQFLMLLCDAGVGGRRGAFKPNVAAKGPAAAAEGAVAVV
jgi:hypothetical protein